VTTKQTADALRLLHQTLADLWVVVRHGRRLLDHGERVQRINANLEAAAAMIAGDAAAQPAVSTGGVS
jgi:hypothetical protein